jgi:ABC-2 type transport system ATP-binding protein
MTTVAAATGGNGNGDHLVQATDVTVRFGPVVALDHFSAKVPRGITGLLGPNGAGKSTFIKTVLGLVAPESGSVLVDGLDPRTEMTRVRDLVGYMPEHDCLITDMNPVAMVSYMGQLSGMTPKEAIQRTHEVLDFVLLGEERYRPIGSYSTGMRQKAKLAQAIVHDPRILFLDEPTNGLDPQGRDEMIDLIRLIGASGMTILVSTHILHEIEQISDSVIIIDSGRLVKEGPTRSLMSTGDGRYRLKLRGKAEAIAAFKEAIRPAFEVVSSADESGQLSMLVEGGGSTAPLFVQAGRSGVQVRYLGPDTLTLEDVFVQVFRGGGRPGR